jgi:uncharacterized membrane protein YgdD (TMEM256/DUF423 family)
MASIKQKIARAKSIISIRTYQRPLVYIIFLMVLINLVILTIAAFIALAIDETYTSFIDAFANGSLKWMLTPNAILTINNPQTLVLAVVVLITGLILFSGTIIALTTNAIKDYIQKKNSGSGKIDLDQHIVILNWNNKVPELVADLLFVEDEPVTVMILADIEKTFAEKQILNAIKKVKKMDKHQDFNVLVKHGDPLAGSDLHDISISKAKTILIMNKDDELIAYDELSYSDLNVIKTVLSLGPIRFEYEPPIVVEIKKITTKTKILTLSKVVHTLHEHVIMPICFDKRLGQIIAQTLIDHRMEDVYLSLFSFQGAEVYDLPDQTFDGCLNQHSHAIPMAYEENHLYVLSSNNQIKHRQSPHPYEPIKLKTKKIVEAYDLEVFIVGENNKLSFIVEAFEQYERLHAAHFKAHAIKDQDLASMIEILNQTSQKTTILLLSDETKTDDGLDANVISHLIELESKLSNPNVRIIVELLNPQNDYIVKDFRIENTIISNKIISLLLSKLALYKETAIFYENLLTIAPNDDAIDGQAVIIRNVKDLLVAEFPIQFESIKQFITSFYQSFKKEYMVFGIIKDGKTIVFEGDLHQSEPFVLSADDDLIIIRL